MEGKGRKGRGNERGRVAEGGRSNECEKKDMVLTTLAVE